MQANKIRFGRIFRALIIITLVIAAIKFTPVEAGTTHLTWTDNSNNEDSFVIVRREFTQVNFIVVDVIGANSIEYTDMVLDGYTYCYKVGAENSAGANYSEEYCVTLPTVPEEPKPKKGKGNTKAPNPNKPVK